LAKYKVINEFVDTEAKGRRRRPGELVELTDKRAQRLSEKSLIDPTPVTEPKPTKPDLEPKPNPKPEPGQEPGPSPGPETGDKVKGKEKALEAERALGGE